MSAGRHLLGLALTAVSLGPVVLGACTTRARTLPAWSGPLARLADTVIALTTVVLVLEVLGTLGWFELPHVVIALAAAGICLTGASRWLLDPGTRRAARPGSEAPPDRGATVVSLLATTLVVGAWVTRVSTSVRTGMRQSDSLYYHLPAAVRFVQDGSIADLRVFDSEPLPTFLPLNTSLVHGYGMLLLGDDALSPYLSLGWLALALLAGWCVGLPYRTAPLTLLATAVVVGAPGVVTTQAGEGLNDIAVTALVLAAVASLVNAGRRGPFLPAVGLSAVTAGLATGTKVTALPIVAVLTVASVALAPSGKRVITGVVSALGLAIGGGYWYVRNAVTAGNPLPTISLALGPLHLDEQPTRSRLDPLAGYVLEGRYWGDIFVPGLERFLGPLWWLVLPAATAGAVLAVVRGRDAAARVVGAVALTGFASHLFSPQNNEWLSEAPVFFLGNLRYIAPTLALGLVALPLARVGPERTWARGLLVGFATLVVAGQLDGVWSTSAQDGDAGASDLLIGLVVAIALAAVVLAASGARVTSTVRWLAGVALVVIAVLVVVDRRFDDRRYRNTPPMGGVYSWARTVHDQRIAIVGENRQYPLAGTDLSNRVQYVARHHDGGLDIGPITNCRAWRAALNRGDFDYVVIAPSLFPVLHSGPPPEEAWIARDPAVRLVRRDHDRFVLGVREVSLYRIEGRLSPRCD